MAEMKAHAVVFPYPYQSHSRPALILAAHLSSAGFSVTYVLPEFLHHRLGLGGGDPFKESGVDIQYVSISDGFSVEFDRDGNFKEYWEGMIKEFPGRVEEEVMGRIMTTTTSSRECVFLVADTLYTWTAEIAERHGIVHVSLCTMPATVFTIAYLLELLRQHRHYGYPGNEKDFINYIPGIESINTKDLMLDIQHPNIIPIVMDIVAKAFEQVKRADFILCNTVQELEPKALFALNQKQPTYAVGPINFYNDIPKCITEMMGIISPQSACTTWLDSKPIGSVLYISFGSIARVDDHDIKEIAYGLLKSEVNFLWVLRTDDHSCLPDGFFDDVKGRGIAVSWCDQKRVLSSSAVGGFLTHCGWNSVLESMWGGVPMLCHPLFSDQYTNRKLVVDDWKIGINVCDGEKIDGEEFASKVNALIKGSMGVELREKANEARKKSRGALEEKGSSHKNLDQFLEDLKMKLYARKGAELQN